MAGQRAARYTKSRSSDDSHSTGAGKMPGKLSRRTVRQGARVTTFRAGGRGSISPPDVVEPAPRGKRAQQA